MNDQLILSIDVGTQSVRAVVFDLQGNTRHIVKTPIEPYFSQRPGWAEQHAPYYWEMLCNTTRKLFTDFTNASAIKGVALTTQRGTVVCLDQKGNPLRPAIVWLDQRKANLEPFTNVITTAGLKMIGLREAVVHAYKESEANWIRQHEPHIWQQTHKYLLLSGYLSYKLTDEFVDSTACTVGYVPFDYKKHQWAGASHLNKKMFPVADELLPRLVQPSQLLGYISKSCAEQTGIPAGLPLIAAASDKACEVLGSGCLTPDIACLSYGTTATVQTTNKRYVEIIRFFPPYPSAVPHMYNTEAIIYRGFWLISWFKQEFGMKEEQLAREMGRSAEELFDELIDDIPSGAMGLTLQPYWSPGIKVPGSEAKGAIIGFGDVHTRAHIYRSILEGLAYGLKDGLLRTQRRTGVKVRHLRVSGGGSQSRKAMQLTADIFDLPAERPHTYETSSLGAAINAAVGLKLYPDFDTAVKNMCRIGEVFEPVARNRDIYKHLFEKVYRRMYNRLQPLYEEIRKATGYPEKI